MTEHAKEGEAKEDGGAQEQGLGSAPLPKPTPCMLKGQNTIHLSWKTIIDIKLK